MAKSACSLCLEDEDTVKWEVQPDLILITLSIAAFVFQLYQFNQRLESHHRSNDHLRYYL